MFLDGAINFPSQYFQFVLAGKQNHAEPQYPDPIIRFGCSLTGRVGMPWGIMWARCVFLIKSIKGRACPTCRARGFQRMFFSRAGAELRVLWGRFFRVRDTTPLSALSEPTRLRNCQPTCGQERTEDQAHTLTCWQVSIIWILNNTITALHLYSACSLNSVHVVIGSGLLSLLCKASGCGGGESIYRAFM